MPPRHKALLRAKFPMNRKYSFCSSNLKVSRLNVDIVVKAPNIPTARNNLEDSGRERDCSELYVMKLRTKDPITLTPKVPRGSLADPWNILDSIKRNTAPMNPPSPTNRIPIIFST